MRFPLAFETIAAMMSEAVSSVPAHAVGTESVGEKMTSNAARHIVRRLREK